MHRLFARLGALALSAAALGACASDAAKPVAAQGSDGAAADTASPGTAPVSLDDEIRAAQLLRAKGDYSGALHTLGQLMLVNPDDARVVGEYGKVLTQQGRAPEAVQFLTRAVELQPGDWTLYSALGVAYDQMRDSAKARQAYQRALVLKPGEPVVLNNFALSRMLAGDPVQAKTLMGEASAAGNPQIARNLALIDGLAEPKAPTAAAVTVSPAPAATPPAASRPPKPLVALRTDGAAIRAPRNIVMQAVPVDPQAGPVSKKSAKLRRLAAEPAAKPPVKSAIPALRLANDRP